MTWQSLSEDIADLFAAPANDTDIAAWQAHRRASANERVSGYRRCALCEKQFRPWRSSPAARFCSVACTSRATAAKARQKLTVSHWARKMGVPLPTLRLRLLRAGHAVGHGVTVDEAAVRSVMTGYQSRKAA